jgi:hypothetical protein
MLVNCTLTTLLFLVACIGQRQKWIIASQNWALQIFLQWVGLCLSC